jgi:hypothetical protein
VKGHLEKPDDRHPSHSLPKEDKLLEWTLFQILEQLKFLNRTMGEISANYKMRQ